MENINKNQIILQILINKKCKSKRKERSTLYYVKGLHVSVPNNVADKIDSFIGNKRYKMLSEFIDIYSDMFTVNF